MARRDTVQGLRPLEGEDIESTHRKDASYWIGVYDDLLKFKLGLLDRVRRELLKMLPVAQKAAADDNTIIERQMEGYQQRLDLWYGRVWDLQGLCLDPKGRMVRHEGQQAALTRREFQLLGFWHRPDRGSLPGQAGGGLRRRRAGRAKILVATNVVARGIDVRHVRLVVNYELPQTADLLTHRTGRMGADGAAVTLITPEDELKWRRLRREGAPDLPRSRPQPPRSFGRRTPPLYQPTDHGLRAGRSNPRRD